MKVSCYRKVSFIKDLSCFPLSLIDLLMLLPVKIEPSSFLSTSCDKFPAAKKRFLEITNFRRHTLAMPNLSSRALQIQFVTSDCSFNLTIVPRIIHKDINQKSPPAFNMKSKTTFPPSKMTSMAFPKPNFVFQWIDRQLACRPFWNNLKKDFLILVPRKRKPYPFWRQENTISPTADPFKDGKLMN